MGIFGKQISLSTFECISKKKKEGGGVAGAFGDECNCAASALVQCHWCAKRLMFALLFDLMIQFLIRNDFTFTDSDMVFSHAVSVVILLKSHIYNWRKTKENVRQVNNLVGMRMKAVNANDIILPHVYAVQPYNRRSTPSINHRPSIHSRPPSNNIWVGKCYGVPPPPISYQRIQKNALDRFVCVCVSHASFWRLQMT